MEPKIKAAVPKRPAPAGRAKSVKSVETAIRRTPLHARGQATFDHILNVTAQLLDEVGYEALNTNMIARVAGINIATLYQYFSNLQAILRELFDRQTDARTAMVSDMISGIENGSDWRKVFAEAIDQTAAMRRDQAGASALRVAMRSSPELLQHDLETTEMIASQLARILVVRAKLDARQGLLVARCSLDMLVGVLDAWAASGDIRDMRMVEEGKKGVLAYLSLYLD